MYLSNKYTTWYNNIIQQAKTRSLTGYKERHHIVPKSLGGSDLQINLVDLTAKEHFVCHLLLTKMTYGKTKEKMVYAAWNMANQENHQQTRYKVSGRTYQHLRQQFSENHAVYMTIRNPMHNSKIRQKHQRAIDQRGKTLGNTGHKRGPISEELRELLRQKTVNLMTTERREIIRQQQLNRTPEQKEKYAFIHSKRISCVYCRALCNLGVLSRWHGDNCKLNNLHVFQQPEIDRSSKLQTHSAVATQFTVELVGG